jgi:hypothetical protein
MSSNRSGGGAWPLGSIELSGPAVNKRAVEARPTQRTLLLGAAALVALVAVTSGCGGGIDTQAAANTEPAPVTYSSSLLSFSHPAAWKAYPFRWAGELHFRPIVYLSTQPVEDPCSTRGNTTSCGFPVKQLEPGGVLVTWNASNPPAVALGPGTRVQVDGRNARRVDTTGGICRTIGADRTIDLLVATRPLPSTLTEFTACLRGPGLAQEEKNVEALLASTKFASQ